MSAETFTFTREVPCADADGVAICEGSVLREIEDGAEGVVTQIARKGDKSYLFPPMVMVGDLVITTSRGCQRITNRYSSWRHIPQVEQTYKQRLLSWFSRKYEHDDSRPISKEEGLAIDGIMALLPENTVNWEMGPWPDRFEDALEFLVDHLTKLSNQRHE